MRPLVARIYIATLLAFSTFSTHALETKLVFQSGQNPNLDLAASKRPSSLTSSSSLEVKGYKFHPYLSGASSITLSQLKPSALGLLDEKQIPIFSSNQSDRMEATLQSSVIYQRGRFAHELGFASSGPQSLVRNSRLFGTHSFSLFNLSSQGGFEWTLSSTRPPLSYYLDFDLKVKQRPSLERGREFAVFFEQTLSESFKTRARIFSLQKFESRPQAYGIDLAVALALSSEWTLKSKASSAEERRSETLKNERGYFKLASGSLDFSFEPRYRHEYSLAVFTQLESEDNPQNQSLRRYGVDGFKISGSFPLSKNDITTAVTMAKNNSGQNLLQFSLSLGRSL